MLTMANLMCAWSIAELHVNKSNHTCSFACRVYNTYMPDAYGLLLVNET